MNGLARIVGAVVGLATGELIAAVSGTIGPTDALSRLVADRLPLAAVELAVFRLHGWDKTALRVTSAAALALLIARAIGPGRSLVSDVFAALIAAGLCAAALRRPPQSYVRAGTIAIVLMVTAAIVTRFADRHLGRAAIIALAATAGTCVVHIRRRRADAMEASTSRQRATSVLPSDGAEAWNHPTPLVTPLRQFHVTDVNFGPPALRIESWRLSISGEVTRPMALDWDALIALGVVDIDAAMVCIHNRVGWERVANARWQAVPLAALRDLVGVRTSANEVLTTAVDAFTISIPVGELEVAGVKSYIAVGMNGRPLTAAHGFPARFLVPGLYGQFGGVKWLTGIHFTDAHIPGEWERRGWPSEAVMARTHSRIDGVRQLDVGAVVLGVAWAPPSGVAAVEVAVDGGSWLPAELAADAGPMSWRRWRYQLAPSPGRHRIGCRAVRADGQVQDGTPRPPFPSGVTGYHEVTAEISPR